MSSETRLILFVALSVTTVVVFLLCQIVGWYLTAGLELPVQVFSTYALEFNLVYSENRGMNFGLFASTGTNQAILAGIAGLVCTAMAIILLRHQRLIAAIAGGLIVGGGLSNIYERLTLGHVFDYLNTPFFGLGNPFSYNVADIFIVLAIAWWVLKS